MRSLEDVVGSRGCVPEDVVAVELHEQFVRVGGGLVVVVRRNCRTRLFLFRLRGELGLSRLADGGVVGGGRRRAPGGVHHGGLYLAYV